MTRQKLWSLLAVTLAFFLFIVVINVYLLARLGDSGSSAFENGPGKHRATLKQLVIDRAGSLRPSYLNRNPRYVAVRIRLLETFDSVAGGSQNASAIWRAANTWPDDNAVYPPFDPGVAKLIHSMRTAEITKARNSPRGTQLKLLLWLEGGQAVLFKPRWYARDRIFTGPVYSGKDRHTAEIVAFYLGAILNFRSTPVAVGRSISLETVYQKADVYLKETMIIKDKNQYCVYGKCFYCRKSEPVCANANHTIEGALLFVVPGTLVKHRSPWQRTYKDGVNAAWQENENYCNPFKSKMAMSRLLDLVDVAIFDFIIQNGDRHHFETRNDRILLLDNGKGFGNPFVDHTDILAPLYQCCLLRRSTWERLLIFSGSSLSEIIEELTAQDQLYPLLTSDHLAAIERRLRIVYAAVEMCLEKYGQLILK